MAAAERIVLHADLDSFFAAVEEREDPSLKGRPVIVGSDPKQGRGRGIVATCNYAARRYGVKSAMPISTAWRLAPQAVYLRPRFPLYSQASRRVMALLFARADVFEKAGIDEAYLEATSLGSFKAAWDLARRLQREVREKEKLSISIGIGPNKLVAKLASDHRKPGGITLVVPRRVIEFLDLKDPGALRGVGPKTREHLARLGLDSMTKLRAAPESLLVSEFGKFGHFLWREARGLDDRPVDPRWETKSIGREHTFDADTADADEVRDTLETCVAAVHAELAREGHWAKTLTVKVRFEGYETHSRQRTLRQATGTLEDLREGAVSLLAPFLRRAKPFRLVGFSVSGLVPPENLLPLT